MGCIRRLLGSIPHSPPRSPYECHEPGEKVLSGSAVAEEDTALDPPDPPGVQHLGSVWTRLPGRGHGSFAARDVRGH